MITPLCYYTHNPKEGHLSNFNDPVGFKITDAIHDKRMNLLFNKHKFSLDDVLCRKYSKHLIWELERDLCGIQFFQIDSSLYHGHPMFASIKRAIVKELTSKFKIKFEE